MEWNQEDERRRKIAFLSQIHLGDLIVAGSMAIAVVTGWVNMDARLARVDEIVAEQRTEQRQLRADMKESVGDLRSEIRDVRSAVDKFSSRMERRGP